MLCYYIAMTALDHGSQTGSALFRHIESLHGPEPWGALLDAGTGTHSIGWIRSLATTRWTAVSGSQAHAAQVGRAVADTRRPGDRIIVGNWADPTLLAGERYDIVLADYLLGAIDGFAPYFQHRLFARLRPLVGKRLYIVGLEPYVAGTPDTTAGRIAWKIGRFRDTCLLLAGEQPYREYPVQWVVDHLEASGFRVTSARRFPIRYKQRFVNSQIDMCAPRLERMADRALATALAAHGSALRDEALAHIEREGCLHHGFDYVLAAEPS